MLATEGLPRFDRIRSEHVVPGLRTLLAKLEQEQQRLEAEVEPTWAGLVEPLERIHTRLEFAWGIVTHLLAVRNSPELREAHDTIQPEVIEFSLCLAQSQPLYEAACRLAEPPARDTLDPAQCRIVEKMVLEARLTGVGLQGLERERFNQIQSELAECGTHFSHHVLDATSAVSLVLRDSAEVEGLPQSLLELAVQSQRQAEDGTPEATLEQGPWRFTLDAPSWVPFLQNCRRRDLREHMYREYVTRASSGDLDNAPLILRILELRREMARLLGYTNYAELSLASKMAPEMAAVEQLLEELRTPSRPVAESELAELQKFARAAGAPEADDLRHWDIPFWSERLREARYAYRDEELRPWFPLAGVLEGLFHLAQRLFGIVVEPADGTVPVWNDDVRFFHVYKETGERIASFYLDVYSRPHNKRGGAWMGECVGRTRLDGSLRIPVAYLICNQTPPVGDKPSLMRFREVETLFHEFGHCLQHMLTSVDYGMASGLHGIEWDAVELPSQFMENWCYDRDTLMGLSGHFETGEPLPEELFEKIRAARTFRAGSLMLRQLYFSLLDLELHQRFDPHGPEALFDVQKRVARNTTVLAPLPDDRFLCAFEHVFSGGYAAGYYSYKWAEVSSADAFAAFEEAGLEDAACTSEIGRHFRDTVLALGGSRAPMDVFRAFRGREPSTRALLRHSGLVEHSASDVSIRHP